MNIRSRIVVLFGIKAVQVSKDPIHELKAIHFEPGEHIGLWQVYHSSQNEIVVGQDEKHLDFRVSFYLESTVFENKELTISTFVRTNNKFGRFYFSFIKPFHVLIVPIMLKAVLKALKKREK